MLRHYVLEIREKKMQALRLRSSVSVKGRNYWGQESRLTFAPHPTGRTGWWWNVGGTLIPVTMDIVETATRRIVLRVDATRLHIWEHIGALRFTGLDSIVVEGSGWPPYDGGSCMYWRALQPNVEDAGYNIPWRSIEQGVRFVYPDGERSTQLRPTQEGLVVESRIAYPKIGEMSGTLRLPKDTETLMTALIPSHSQGWPLWVYGPMCATLYVSDLVESAINYRFPHFRPNQMTWLQKFGRNRTRQEFWRHRMLDILGAMNLIFHDALPNCRVTSNCSGHYGDVEAIKKLHL